LFLNQILAKEPLSIPKAPKWLVLGLCAIILLQLVNIFTKNPLVWSDYLYYVVFFVGYFLFLYQDLVENGPDALASYARSLLASTFIIVPVGILQLCGYPMIKTHLVSIIEENYASTFGNINYTGQFLAISSLFFLLGISVSKSKLSKRIFFCGIVVAVTYFSYLNTRSIIVGMTLALGWLLWRRSILDKKILGKIILACLIVIPFSRYVIAQIPRPFADESRITSAHIRLDMWRGTLKMISDHPLGVGIDNFNFSFVPYRSDVQLQVGDNDNILNPHNEFLAMTAESGIPTMLLIFGLFAFIILRFMKSKPAFDADVRYSDFIKGLMILYFVEMVFQFPLDGQWSLIIGSLLISFVMLTSFEQKALPVGLVKRASLAIGLFMFYSTVMWYLPMAALRESFDVNKAKFSCNERPQEWFACNRYAQAVYKSGDAAKAEAILNNELKKQPNNWFAMGLLGQIFVETGRQQEGCELYRKVDRIFNGKSRTHAYIASNCK
jgi:O-antigen ligase